jgi:hypothetical protein
MKLIIKANDRKLATGHRPHITGTGAHRDKRLKRQHTRGNQRRAALADW